MYFSGFQPLPSPSSGDDHDISPPSVHEFQPPLMPPILPLVDAEGSGNDGPISGVSDPPSPVVMEECHDGVSRSCSSNIGKWGGRPWKWEGQRTQ